MSKENFVQYLNDQGYDAIIADGTPTIYSSERNARATIQKVANECEYAGQFIIKDAEY